MKKIFILVFLLILSTLLVAEENQGETASEAPKPVPESLISPRATMATFIHSMNDVKDGELEKITDAISALDLESVNPLVRNERGKNLAWLLLEVMDRTRLVNLEKITDKQEGNHWIFQKYEAGTIRISRYADGRWLFDNETVVNLEKIWAEVEGRDRVKGLESNDEHLPLHLRMRNRIPAELQKVHFLLESWHWFGLLAIIALGLFIDKIIAISLSVFVRRWRNKRENSSLAEVSEEILRPLGLMAMAAIWWVGINMLGLPEQAMLILLVAVKFLAGISGVWAAYRLVDIVGVYLLKRARATDTKMDDALVPLIPKTLKIFVTVVGIIFVADNLNINVSGLIAGLGLGGLAFALASKDMVQNLFGSVTILLDRTFAVGDWVIVDGKEGSVESIGFRSTRIRTFYNSRLTVPNSTFITAKVDNMGERRFRRLSTKLGLAYETPPDKIEAFCEGVRELVRQHPYMRKDYFHVYFNGYADSALEILVYVFWETPEWSTELRERHRFLLDILRLARDLGVDFAYPTQTLYMKNDSEANDIKEENDQEVALAQGRDLAKRIVEESTGLGVKPPPVKF
ncbi:MAG: mechanosensitive ion channel [Gammaproteobacteria bacterium]|nr:mechanosensitive ion channel [Gammaproteobacteria bacterium]